MAPENNTDPILETFLYENLSLIERVELILVESETEKKLDDEAIREIFRAMHTIKGAAAMMGFDAMASTAHLVEDLFDCLRQNAESCDYTQLSDELLPILDYLRNCLSLVEQGEVPPQLDEKLVEPIQKSLSELKQDPQKEKAGHPAPIDGKTALDRARERRLMEQPPLESFDYCVWMDFEADCQMEGMRAFTALKRLEEAADLLAYRPEDLDQGDTTDQLIRDQGFVTWLNCRLTVDELRQYLESNVLFIHTIKIMTQAEYAAKANNKKDSGKTAAADEVVPAHVVPEKAPEAADSTAPTHLQKRQNFINVNVNKLDKLMDIVGELITSELMVTHNPELAGLNLKGFDRAANQLRKVTDELQDMVMSIRMVPIAGTFQSMQRIVRDMCRKLGKDIALNLSGEETEVDKNVIDLISDPLMHLIRNCIDHGIESPAERLALGKPEKGNIYLEARHESGEVCLTIRDDGHGLDRAKILAKARKSNLINDDGAGLSDKEVWSFILKAGFSTNEQVTEFSGRGVGMDVVMQNLEQIGGKLQIESEMNQGTSFLIRIPLTLAIIDGMEIAVGNKRFTIPISMIREAFRHKDEAVVLDSSQNELIMIRGRSHQIIRLHRTFKLETPVEDLKEGIIIVLEHDTKAICLFADRMLGEHQVVVKPIPPYIGQIEGVAGCSIMSDGTVSLILDINGLIERGASRS